MISRLCRFTLHFWLMRSIYVPFAFHVLSPNPQPPNTTLIAGLQNTKIGISWGYPHQETQQTHISMVFRGRGRVAREGWQKPASTGTKKRRNRRQDKAVDKRRARKKPVVIEIHVFYGGTPMKNHGGMAILRRYMVPKMASRYTQGCFPPAKWQTTPMKSIVQ
jgi:hypothetical protein